MRKTQKNQDMLRSSIAAYVRRQFRALPEADAEDLISAAYCIAKARHGKEKRHLSRAAKLSVLDAFRRCNTAQNAFSRAFQPLETPTEEDEREKADYSDHGAGVERMTRQIDAEDERLPDWVYGVRIERAKLNRDERRIANGLANGKSAHTIQREMHLNWGTFRVKMKNLQTRFRPYYKGLCAWRVSHRLSRI